MLKRRLLAVSSASLCLAMALAGRAHAQILGSTFAHDPSSLVKEGNRYYYWYTSNQLVTHTSTDMVNWTNAPSALPTIPAWAQQFVPQFTGQYWAPDATFMNGRYYLYYSVAIQGAPTAAIGVMSTPTLDSTSPNYNWVDHGKVIASTTSPSTPWLAIDPSILQDGTRTWMSFGSYRDGIYITEINQSTGLMKNPSSTPTRVADNGNRIEGSSLVKRGSYYYLFVNFGRCCAGVDSTYDIRVGRSASPTGPFLDRDGVDMLSGGGTVFLDDNGKRIGPGHFGLYSEAGQDYYSYHYYDGANTGSAAYDLRRLYWNTADWPMASQLVSEWTGSAGGDWSTAASWRDGSPGGIGHVATFATNAAGNYSVNLTTAQTLARVNFNSASPYTIGASAGPAITLDTDVTGDNVTLNVEDGNHRLNAPLNALDSLAVNVSYGSDSLQLGGALSAPQFNKYGYGTLHVTHSMAIANSLLLRYGNMNVSGSITLGANLHVGYIQGELGTMTVSDAGSVNAAGEIIVGDTGRYATVGVLNIRDNASVTSSGFYVGSASGSNTDGDGTINQSGGTLNVASASDARFIVGGRGFVDGVGRYNLSGGAVNANTNVRIGSLGTGTVTQTGGAFNTNASVALGKFAGSNGTWSITGGALNLTAANKQLVIGEAGTGSLTIGGRGVVNSLSPVKLGLTGGTGTLVLDGGVLVTSSISRGTGTGTLTFNGGTLRANANVTSFLQGLTAATIGGGGAIVDTQNFAVTIGQGLLRDPGLAPPSPDAAPLDDGGLTKRGSGTLTLSGANTFTGRTTVEAGTLLFGSTQTNRTWLQVDNGATARIASPGGKAIVLSHLTLGATALLDVRENGVLLAGRANAITDSIIRGWIAQGRIVTSATTPGATIGYGEMTALGLASYNGVARPAEPTYLIYQTLAGDATLDGAIDLADLMSMANSYGAPADANWSQGDFDYDGDVGFDDLQLLAQAYGTMPHGTALEAFPPAFADAIRLLPEPATLVAWLSATTVLGQRRRARSGYHASPGAR